MLTGASGTGKSSVRRVLNSLLGEQVIVLEQDVLWIGALRDPADDFGNFRTTWLRMVGMLHQSGRPAVLCGTVAPPQLEDRPERALVGQTHYMALTADDDVLRARLQQRPAWRGWDDERRITEMLDFNGWIKGNAATTSPQMTVLDTTEADVGVTAKAVATWVTQRLCD